jgi:hypothetical protein
VFVPVSTVLLELLRQLSTLSRPKNTSSKPPNLLLVLKLNKSVLDSQAAQVSVVRRTLDLILDCYRSQFYSIAYPELVRPSPGLLQTHCFCGLLALSVHVE